MHLRSLHLLLLLLLLRPAIAQRGLAFTRFSTEDGTGLASNVVSSIYQDERGFIWVGTANGLQRFDGRKFIQFSSVHSDGNAMPFTTVGQIVPVDSGLLLLSFPSLHQFGLFNPRSFRYQRVTLRNRKPLPARAEFRIYRVGNGQLLMNISGREILQYNKQQNAFEPTQSFAIPANWRVSMGAVFEDHVKKQLWFGCDSGIVIYDRRSGQTWSRLNNPRKLPVFANPKLQNYITELYIDRKRRIWVFSWPTWANGSQVKQCFDSTGTISLNQDTLGLNSTQKGYHEYAAMYESRDGALWVYGLRVLRSYDQYSGRFVTHQSGSGIKDLSIDFKYTHQVLQDRDGAIWIATDRGLYFTAYSDNSFNTTNLVFGESRSQTSINDILQVPDGNYWLSSWGTGVYTLSQDLAPLKNAVYQPEPETQLPEKIAESAYLPWTLCRETATGKIWIGCNTGVLIVHDPAQGRSQYLQPEILKQSTIRFIAEDRKRRLWLGTQSGRLVRWEKGQYRLMCDIGTIIYKIFFDKQGLLWLATHDKGLYAVDPENGQLLQHYTTDGPRGRLFSNTGNDIEQLNDSIIVYGAGALNFVNKKTGSVRIIEYGTGLPSNNVSRLRMDGQGFLWIITSNGLCRYNPANNRITRYGRADGIMVAEQTMATDYLDANGWMLFAGQNALLRFDPASYRTNLPPNDVTITDFRLFNQFIPADSLAQIPEVKLQHNENTFAIHFASLSYIQRDKLTYYYQMKGIDKGWVPADRSNVVNYQLLPPGRYTFRVYCETIEGIRSNNITEWHFYIRPPFWRTKWFWSSMVLLLGVIIYFIHNLRVNRLLAVEKLRNRVARDLHDDMGSTLSTINILSSMAKTKMHTDTVKTSEYLSKISDNSQRMMEAMDDIVWSIKPTNDSMQRIAARMREFATSVLEARDTELDFQVQEEVYEVKLNMEARRDFFLLFKEAVNNAAKYAKARHVEVRLGLRHRTLVLSVQDDGCGFDVASADGGNGLGNMQKRADAMNGKVRIDSAPGLGTTVTVSIPLAQRLQS